MFYIFYVLLLCECFMEPVNIFLCYTIFVSNFNTLTSRRSGFYNNISNSYVMSKCDLFEIWITPNDRRICLISLNILCLKGQWVSCICVLHIHLFVYAYMDPFLSLQNEIQWHLVFSSLVNKCKEKYFHTVGNVDCRQKLKPFFSH